MVYHVHPPVRSSYQALSWHGMVGFWRKTPSKQLICIYQYLLYFMVTKKRKEE